MTIVAGFRTHQGIVLCADTQETVGTTKRQVPKLIFHPSNVARMRCDPTYLAAAFCGAGDGPFVDLLVEEAWKGAQDADDLDDACGRVSTTIKNTYREYGQIFQAGSCPSVELVYGIKMGDDSRLFSASGPIVNEKKGYTSSGAGYYMADFLCARMYKDYLPLNSCVILAAYILLQAKEHVDGCGGDSHIAILRNEGISGQVEYRRVEAISNLLQSADQELGDILLSTANLEMGSVEFKESLNSNVETLDSLRTRTRQDIEDARKRWSSISKILGGPDYQEAPTDLFGLTLPKLE